MLKNLQFQETIAIFIWYDLPEPFHLKVEFIYGDLAVTLLFLNYREIIIYRVPDVDWQLQCRSFQKLILRLLSIGADS